MTTLSPISAKQLARLKQAGKVRKGTFIIDVKDAKERQDAIGRGIREVLFGKVKAGKSERSRAMAEADKWFSEFIRLRDAGTFGGRAKCVTCSHTAHWRQMQCGHFVTRGHQATRYDERNSHAQCRGCNYNGGQHLKHADAIEVKYGQGTVKTLEDKGRQRCSRTTSDFLFLASTYRSRVERIRETEPGKYAT